jgi:hypothetical protein
LLICNAHCTGASGVVEKTSAIPSPAGKSDQFARRFRTLECFRASDNLIKFLQHFVLLVNEQLRITDDVYEQDMGDFETKIEVRFGHNTSVAYTPQNAQCSTRLRNGYGLASAQYPIFNESAIRDR